MKQRSSTKRPKESPKVVRHVPEDERTSEDIRREYRELVRGLSEAAESMMREEREIWVPKRPHDVGDE